MWQWFMLVLKTAIIAGMPSDKHVYIQMSVMSSWLYDPNVL